MRLSAWLCPWPIKNRPALKADVERAQAMHNEGLHGSKDMRLAASVPVVIVEKYLNDHGITLQELGRSQEHQRRLLNDPALAHFRIWKGRV